MTGGAENAAGKQRGRPFRRGVSGNSCGKTAGTRHGVTLLPERMMKASSHAAANSLTLRRRCWVHRPTRGIVTSPGPAVRSMPAQSTGSA